MFRSRHFRALRDGLSMEGQRQGRHTRRLERRRQGRRQVKTVARVAQASWVRVGQKAGYC